jgi:prepilin-type N-terminal cleavage/methylation domain-containing protein
MLLWVGVTMVRKEKLLQGFTLVEILVVIGIIGILSTLIFAAVFNHFRKAKITRAIADASVLKIATQLYFKDMGFYPPDVVMGVDPGFTQQLPYFPDGHLGSTGINCSHCPSGWEDIIAQNWRGPYLGEWPVTTPWGGKYDYNYWGSDTSRYECIVPAGIYAGVQEDYDNNNTIPQAAEQELIDRGYDSDNCINGESQLVLVRF